MYGLNKEEIKLFQRLNTPAKIQDFLEQIPINFERGRQTCYSPRQVLKYRRAHCMEGAMLAAAILKFHGHKPLVVDLRAHKRDRNHAIAVFKINPAPSCRGIAPRRKAILSHSSPQQAAGYSGRCWINSEWGAISKTNHAVLRYREPVYNSLRELVMSYFHEYFLNDGKKTLRSYSEPVDLSRFDTKNWITSDTDLWYIDEYLNRVPHTSILNKKQVASLRRADKIEIRAGKLTTFKRGSK